MEYHGKLLNVNRTTYQAYEEGRAEPPIWVLKCISIYFEVTIDDLLKKRFYIEPLRIQDSYYHILKYGK
jgi:DNA-binding XRE family transcriptional regulator